MISSHSVWRRVTYVPRFARHYWHRVRGGYALGHALESTMLRMREPRR
jgi:hypothetical protein